MSGYVVDTDVMRSQANKLNVVKDGLDEATQAGLNGVGQTGAFGLLCGFLEPPAFAVQSACTAAIGGLALTAGGASLAIQAIADGYDAADEAVGGLISRVLSELPTGP